MKKLSVHLQEDENESLQHALNYLQNFISGCPAESAQAVLVVNGPAVRLFCPHSPMEAAIRCALANSQIQIKLCRHALMRAKVPEYLPIPGCQIVPLGIVELVDLQADGFAYVKA